MDCNVNVNGTSATVAVEGRLSAAEVPGLEEALDIIGEEVVNFKLDLSKLDYIASAGLRVLVAVGKTAAGRGGALTLEHPTANVRDVLEMTGLSSVFNVVD